MNRVAHRFQALLIFFFLFINLSCLCIILYRQELLGDIDKEPISLTNLAVIALFIVGTLFFIFLQSLMKVRFGRNLQSVDTSNLLYWVEKLIILSLTLKIVGFIFFGYGVAESRSAASFGFVFRLIPTYVLFMMLFLLPDKFAKRYVAYVVVHVLTMLAMGWTGGLFDIFWLVVFRWLKNSESNYGIFIFVFAVVIAFLLAPYIYALKFYIRWGDDFQFSYLSVLSHLLARLSYFPPMVFSFQSGNEFVIYANQYLMPGFTVFDSITSVLPRSLLGIQLENLETLFVKVSTGEFNEGIVFYLGLPGKIITAAYISLVDLFATLVVFLFLAFSLLIVLRYLFGVYALVPWALIIFKWFLSGSFEEPTYYLYGFILMLLISRIRIGRIAN